MRSCVFFFQAEDGIRDYKVTGVQTCALPISVDEAETVFHGIPLDVELCGPVLYSLESRLVDGESQPVSPDQLVVGATPLQVLADHVNVLEMALEQVTLVDRRGTGGVVGGVDDLDRQPNRVRRGEAQGRALVQADRVRGAHRSEEHTSELQSPCNLVCRLLLE